MTTFTTQDREEMQRAPLTEDQIHNIWRNTQTNLPNMWRNGDSNAPFYIEYARAIERAHGIL